MRYFMRWPIVDDDARMSDLHEDALNDLHHELDARGFIAFGDITFTLETIEMPEDVDVVELHAAVDVVPFRKDAA